MKYAIIFALALLMGSFANAAQIDSKFIANGAITSDKIATGACATNIGSGVFDAAGAAAGIVASSISDSDTTHCPDGNSIFDALAGKSGTGHDHSGVYDPAGTAAGYIEDSVTNGVTNKVPTENAVYDAIAAIPSAKTSYHQVLTLIADDVTAGYVDAGQDCVIASVSVSVGGTMALIGTDITLSSVSSKTRLTFGTPFATGGVSALVAGDKLQLFCMY